MRKDDLQADGLYAANGPGQSWDCAKLVRVRVLEVGVVADTHRRGARVANGSRVRLERDVSWQTWGKTKTAEAGAEYVVSNKNISHEWTDADDERQADVVKAKAATAELRDRLMAVGLPPAVDGYTKRSRIIDGEIIEAEDVEGFRISPMEVTIDRLAFLRWLERIDPATIAVKAIEEYAIAAEGYTVITASKDRAVNAIMAELAITEKDLEAQ